ncbi:MAG: hypothetical protein ACI4VP_02600 [Clostridia bacterium]
MRDLIGKYIRNRKIIWFIIGISIVIIVLIHIINTEFQQEEFEFDDSEKVISNPYYDNNYSVVSSEKLNKSVSDNVTNVIKQFINYCNDGDIENAYSLLSEDCKKVLYPTLEDFKKNYYNNNFYEEKTYNLQSWITYNNKFIYRIELKKDVLSTGITSNEKKIDYYTVIKQEDNYYLNISGFIEKNNINISKNENLIDFVIESEEVFIDYLALNIKVDNNTQNSILLDSGEKGNTVYVTDGEQIQYVSYLFEQNNLDLVINKKSSKEFKIKFMKDYKENRPIKSITFADVVLNYKTNNSEKLNVTIVL